MKIQRNLLPALKQHIEAPEMTLLVGPRQAGKTTLLQYLQQTLEAEGKSCWFFNLDIDRDAQYFKSQETLVRHLSALTGEQYAIIFIDEIQRLTNAGLFLKGIYDRQLPYKFVLTGSGSLELKEKVAESMVGRKRNFFLSTVNISEWAAFTTDYRYKDRLPALLETDALLADRILSDYLTFGGYPRVLLLQTAFEKNAMLQEIYQGYIERDIRALLQLEKTNAFVTLLQLVANRAGQLINYQDLAKMTGLSTPTLKNYLWYAEKTFIISSVTPFFKNKDKEIIKSPQYYFWDIGLRNFLRGVYDDPSDIGMRFQNLVFLLLEKKFRNSVARIHFWRTQTQAEVDFVVRQGTRLLPVEAKAGALKKPTISRSLRSFIKKYQPTECWVVNKELRTNLLVEETTVYFLPWYDLIVY
jgi:predicted AAA+ superfamily ATPase